MKNIIAKSFEPIYGQFCWGVEYSPITNLSMSFGTPTIKVVREPNRAKSRLPSVRRNWRRRLVTVRGRWWLWVYLCYWRIAYRNHAATQSSFREEIFQATKDINGQRLVEVEVNPESGATRFAFDLGGTIEVRRQRRESDDELWLLYKPRGYVLSVRGNGTYDHGPGSGIDQRRELLRRKLPGRQASALVR